MTMNGTKLKTVSDKIKIPIIRIIPIRLLFIKYFNLFLMLSKIRALFSNSKVEIFFLKDCLQGFKGEIKLVKPNHIKV